MSSRIPRRSPRARLAILGALAMLLPALASAQLRHNDYTLPTTQFDPSKSSSAFGQSWNAKNPELNQSIGGQKILLGQFNTSTSALNGKVAAANWQTAFSQTTSFGTKMAPSAKVSAPTFTSQNGQMAQINEAASYNNWQRHTGPSKFGDMLTLHTGTNTDQFQQLGQRIGKELSMQDINRFEFRRSHSSDPGLPVTHAGSGTETSPDGSSRSSPLISSPSLFDSFGGSAATNSSPSTVRSGGAVAPRLITPGGDRPIMPTQGTSSLSGTGNPAPRPPAPRPPNAMQDYLKDYYAPAPGSAEGPVPDLTPKQRLFKITDPSKVEPPTLGEKKAWARVKPD